MSGESVKVVVRVRPMNQRERDLKCEVIFFIVRLGSTLFLNALDLELRT